MNINLSTRTSAKNHYPKNVPNEEKLVQSTHFKKDNQGVQPKLDDNSRQRVNIKSEGNKKPVKIGTQDGILSAERKPEFVEQTNKNPIVEAKEIIKKDPVRALEHIQECEPVSFIQSNFLKPGYKGTEYQILVLLIKLLESFKQPGNTVGLMEVANLGILDDCVLVTYPPSAKGTDGEVQKVEASQIKYFKHPIGKAQFEKKDAKIGIDKLFKGYLALKNQYPNANLITSLYTNTTINAAVSTKEVKVSTKEAADKSYLIIKEPWVDYCLNVRNKEVTKIPDNIFSNSKFFEQYKKSLNIKALNELPKGLIYGECIYKDIPYRLPKIIDFQRKLCRDIDTIEDHEWDDIKRYFYARIKKKSTMTADDFVEKVKTILSAVKRTNENIESALAKFIIEKPDNQEKQAQEFLDNFRIYVNQDGYKVHYSNGIKLLTQFRSSPETDVIDVDSTLREKRYYICICFKSSEVVVYEKL